MYTLDTNAIIYYLENDRDVVAQLRTMLLAKGNTYVSTISELELFSYPPLTQDGSEKINRILGAVTIMSLDSRIARIAGLLRRRYGLKTPDSAIAATALLTGTTLVTRNMRDFRKVTELTLQAV